VIIRDSNFSNNNAAEGSGTLENVEMWKNRARLGGGGLLGDMDLKLRNSSPSAT
jgi:hypothetical protein